MAKLSPAAGLSVRGLEPQLLAKPAAHPQSVSSEQEEQLSNTSRSNSAAVVLGPGLGSSKGVLLLPCGDFLAAGQLGAWEGPGTGSAADEVLGLSISSLLFEVCSSDRSATEDDFEEFAMDITQGVQSLLTSLWVEHGSICTS